MEPDKLDTVVTLAKLLLDEERLKIIGCLALRPRTVREIAAELGLREGAAGRHVAGLAALGLVQPQAGEDAPQYALDAAGIQVIKRDLFAGEAQPPAAALDQADRVLRNFLDGERLKEIPASHAKRQVILEWLAGKFELGVTYPERQVNEIIGRHHPDYAALRRYLVDAGLMQRADGKYWRME
jgi:DNA-binding transcriptional ArsR family regulator